MRVRYAAHTAAVRVKYLNPTVSNELLYEAFSMFGEIERAIVAIDERGKSTGEGLVEFARKPGANAAIKRVNEGVFLLGRYFYSNRHSAANNLKTKVHASHHHD